MKSPLAILSALLLLVGPVQAQWPPSLSVNLGAAFPRDTLALETTMRISCSTTHTGMCLDGTIGFDWGRPYTAVYDLLDLDGGFSAAFGTERRTSILVRVGGSSWIMNDKTDKTGYNAGIACRHLVRQRKTWRADFNWRRFRGFTWPSVTVGIEWNSPY